MQLSKVSHVPPSQPTPSPEPPPSAAKAVTQQALLFAGGVATFVGLYEFAAPFITWATSCDPTFVLPARASAAAAVGAFGGPAAVLMESTYDTVTAAAVATKRDPSLPLESALAETVHEQQRELPRELVRGGATSAAAGAVLGALASFYPDTTIWVSITAVGGALSYGLAMLGIEASRAIRSFDRAKKHAQKGEHEDAHEARAAGHEHLRLAGRAALESITVAAVTHHVIGEVGHAIGSETFGHDPEKAGKIVVSTAEQIPGAVESVAEVAEAFTVGVREAHDAAQRVTSRGGTNAGATAAKSKHD